jgi:Trk K+ transport system NAD-binding subunit
MQAIILCGLGRMGARVLEYLRAAGLQATVIDNLAEPKDPRLQGFRLVRGDCRRPDTLREAGVESARGVLVLTNDDQLNLSTALAARTINPEVRIVLRMFNQNLLSRMGRTVRNVFAISTSLLVAPMVATAALTGQSVGTFRIDDGPAGLRQLVEAPIHEGSPLAGQPVKSAVAGRDLIILAHLPATGEPRVLNDVGLDGLLAPGDRLVLCGPPSELSSLLTGKEEADGLRWAGWLARGWRILRGLAAQVDLAVLIVLAVLAATLLASTLILMLGVEKYRRPHDAFLRAVSIMATGAPLKEEDYEDNPGIRVFVPLLRIAGAAIIAAFTAILTNYLIRARLGGALEVRRIPESGHVIVSGLSPVGFRVTEELINLGEKVVVIEEDAACRFVPTARRLGAAVMIGDATVMEVLKQANAATARAVIGATNKDLANLEVALLARELNPQQRVVPLVADPQLAQMLREASDIRLAVSVPALAASASVAGLFGDRVLNVFQIMDRMYAALDLIIHKDDPLIGQPVRAIASDYRFAPVALIRKEGDASGLQTSLPSSRLSEGDRVIGITALTDLERLLCREPAPRTSAVVALACTTPARSWLAGLLRTWRGMSQDEAERAAASLPQTVAEGLSQGEAEDLMAQLARERVTATIQRPAPSSGLENGGSA